MKTNRKHYSKQQIRSAIQHWQRVLECEEVFDFVASKMLNESMADKKDISKVKQEVRTQVETPADAKQFVDEYDAKVSASKNSKLKQLWEHVKTILKSGTKFVTKHWKFILLVIGAALVYVKGPGWCAQKILILLLKAANWILGKTVGTGLEELANLDKGTPHAIRAQADGNGGLNAFFDPGGWN